MTISFGLQDAEISVTDMQLNAQDSAFTLATPLGSAAITLAVPGEHNVRNALAAAAAAIALQIPLHGDMGEVGSDAAACHAEIGAYAKQSGIQTLFAVGEHMRQAISSFGEQGQHFANKAELSRALQHAITPETQILVKGSRFMRMEEIVSDLEGVQACC